jgi:hypothetical protein
MRSKRNGGRRVSNRGSLTSDCAQPRLRSTRGGGGRSGVRVFLPEMVKGLVERKTAGWRSQAQLGAVGRSVFISSQRFRKKPVLESACAGQLDSSRL